MAIVARIFGSLKNSIDVGCYSNTETICAYWWKSRNWGDALNPILIRLLSGKTPVHISGNYLDIHRRPTYAVIGSILQGIDRELIKKTSIWGAGLISETGKLSGVPKEIHAVRGPLTREKIIAGGIRCPEIYGDPALLYPRFFHPKKNPRHLLGIIPHYVDKKDKIIKKFEAEPGVKIIDIEGDIHEVVKNICSCRYIASSSLHGIIAADAYGIPSTWVEFSNKIVGNGFKFRDYFASVERSNSEPLRITDLTTIDDILGEFYCYKIKIDLDRLLEACPFHGSTSTGGRT